MTEDLKRLIAEMDGPYTGRPEHRGVWVREVDEDWIREQRPTLTGSEWALLVEAAVAGI